MSYFEFPHTRTYDSDLGWLIKTVKMLTDLVDGLEDWKATHEEEYKELKDFQNAILGGKFPPSLVTAFNKWAAENMPDLLHDAVLSVWFGLTDDGYFVAYIPTSWAEIIFNTTGLDIFIPDEDYGHLVLSFDAIEEE